MTAWPVEPIANEDMLYMRVHRMFVHDGELQPGVFRDHGGSMSVHWSKYCRSAHAARLFARRPSENGVISFIAGAVRAVPLIVDHSPIVEPPDRSHTDVKGSKTAEVRLRLLEIAQWQVRPNDPL